MILQDEAQTESCGSEVDKMLSAAVEENIELTKQQKDFCLYFTRTRNATRAYVRAYRCSRSSARANGARMIANDNIQAELSRLRAIKNAALGDLCGDDIVELHMRIAFADITEFVEFSDGEVRIKDSSMIDGLLISEVTKGEDGIKIKLVDKQRSLHFLENYFELNPMDKHKKSFENEKVDIEKKRFELIASGEDPEGEDTSETDAAIYD